MMMKIVKYVLLKKIPLNEGFFCYELMYNIIYNIKIFYTNMSIFSILSSLKDKTKSVDLSKSTTNGIFYPKDFSIKIKKASEEDINYYKKNFQHNNILSIINCMIKIVNNNTIIKNGSFADIKALDLYYIFLEIVKFTLDKEICVNLGDIQISINDNYSYFDYSKYEFDNDTREFLMNGYRFSLPTMGIEDCLARYIFGKKEIKKEYNFYFVYFLGNKNYLSFNEIDNLMSLFNEDMSSEEHDKIEEIVNTFKTWNDIKLIHKGFEVDLKYNLDLRNLFD